MTNSKVFGGGARVNFFKKYLNKQYTGRVKEKTLESIKTD